MSVTYRELVAYIGDKESIEHNKYQKSYKLVFMLAYFSSSFVNPEVSLEVIYRKSYEIYQVIESKKVNINESDVISSPVKLKDVRNTFRDSPLNALLSGGFFIYGENRETLMIKHADRELDINEKNQLIERLYLKLGVYFKIDLSRSGYMDEFCQQLSETVTQYAKAMREPFKEHLVAISLRDDLVSNLRKGCGAYHLILKGSAGNGNWAAVPWIALMDTRVSSGITNGYYLVYLINPNNKIIYLSLAYGVTEIYEKHSKSEADKIISDLVNEKREQLSKEHELSMDLGDGDLGKKYVHATILAEEFKLNDIVNTELMESKLIEFMDYYNFLIDRDHNAKAISSNEDIIEDFQKLLVQSINHFKSCRLTYKNELIKSCLVSLKTKPFTLLAGLSGSGKTKFVRELSKSCGATASNRRYLQIAVRPDWTDTSDVLGYTDLKGDFKPTELTQLIKDANENRKIPYFVCFDEMNLARVEHYFSDFLSKMETLELRDNGLVESDRLLSDIEGFSQLVISDNIYFFGTVNMDETTHPFSNKVLDRANTIEFNHINLMALFDQVHEDDFEIFEVSNTAIKGEFSNIMEAVTSIGEQTARELVNELEKINSLLQEVDLSFGYRVRNEVLLYISYALKHNILSRDESFDFVLLQKVLPKFKGSDPRVKHALFEMFKLCHDKSAKVDSNRYLHEVMNDTLKNSVAKYPESASKLVKLMRGFEVDGYASFW